MFHCGHVAILKVAKEVCGCERSCHDDLDTFSDRAFPRQMYNREDTILLLEFIVMLSSIEGAAQICH